MTALSATATRAFALMALVAGCTQPPDRVFVPGSPFTHVIEVRTAQGATAARFSAPGRYVLKATSSTWCSPKVDSNTLVVVVRP